MKGGVAVALQLADDRRRPTATSPTSSTTARRSRPSATGCSSCSQPTPSCSQADFAVLMEPSERRRRGRLPGHHARRRRDPRRARALRPLLDGRQRDPRAPPRCSSRLSGYEPRRPVIDGLEYREGLNAVCISGGVAGNVVPDECVVTVNYRFAPDRSEEEAEAFVREFFDGVRGRRHATRAPGALPGLVGPGGGRVRGGRRRRARPEVRLDRRGPVHRPRRPRGELRSRRPAVRPQAGRVRARRSRSSTSRPTLTKWLTS